MATLKRLINGQNVTFDTHQAGDGQEVNWRAVHLEKSMHGKRGKIRFPLVEGNRPWTSSGMSREDEESLVSEVSRELQGNPGLVHELAETVVNTLKRYSRGEATTDEAKSAARRLANIFELDEEFIEYSERFAKKRLVAAVSLHVSLDTGNVHEIYQDGKQVRITKVRDHVMY